MTEQKSRLNGITQVWEQISRVVFILLTCLIGIISWQGKEMLRTIGDHEKRISVIEGSRYTVSDAREDTLKVLDRIADLRRWIESNFPPTYLLNNVSKLETNQNELRKNQEDIQKTMADQCQLIQKELAQMREQMAKYK